MYFGSSVVSKASTIGIEIVPTRPLLFEGGQKVRKFASFSKSLKFEQPAFENAASCPNAEAIADAIVSHHTQLVLLHCLRKCSSSEIA